MQPFRNAIAVRDVLPGQVLRGSGGARYFVHECIGEGGQGWVFTAGWNGPGGYVVILKVLRPDVVAPESLARFRREAQVLRMLGQTPTPNPHIVRFFDHATDRVTVPSSPSTGAAALGGGGGGSDTIDLPFTVLEYIRGPTLEHVLSHSRGTGLPLDRVRRIGGHVALALKDVHAHKVVHRDLKPSNVLLANDGGIETAKVTDFGLVKMVDIGLGRTSTLAGATLGYAPPEQFEQGNQRVSARTDVFSFAAMLYELLTGAKAFPHGDGENPLLVVMRLLNGPRPSLVRARGVLDPDLAGRADLVERVEAEIVRATAAEPSERQGSIAELWSAIDPVLRAASDRRALSPMATRNSGMPDSIDGRPYHPGAGDTMVTPVDLAALAPLAVARSGHAPPAHPVSAQAASGAPSPAASAAPVAVVPLADSVGATFVDPPVPARGLGMDATLRPTILSASEDDARAGDPAAWTWRVCAPPVSAGAVRAATFDASGERAFATGPVGLVRWEGQGWTPVSSAPELDVRAVRGLAWMRSGQLLAFGARGLVARLAPAGRLDVWPVTEREVTFHGAYADERVMVTLVGERPVQRAGRSGSSGAGGPTTTSTVAVVAQFTNGKLTLMSDVPGCARLRGIARLRTAGLVACGDWGTVAHLALAAPQPVRSICGGHLNAIGALRDGGAVTVGAGGHALSLSPRLDAQLEAVQTTRDLGALTLDPSGVAWAGSAQARLLRRTAGSWVRMSGDLGLASSVVALWAAARTVRAVCDDGAVVEGTVSPA